MASGALIQSLSRARLIDEYQLTITPLVLGEGRRLRGVRANRRCTTAGAALRTVPAGTLATGTAPP
jgi:dihydrofolate reductase